MKLSKKTLAEKIEEATDPSQLFELDGSTASELRASLRTAFRGMLLAVHPDRNASSSYAEDLTAKLNILHDLAASRIAAGVWGKPAGPEIAFKHAGKEAKLVGIEPVGRGDLCAIYSAVMEPGSTPVIVKLADKSDFALLANESTVLHKLWSLALAGKDVSFSRYLPECIDTVRVDGKSANIIKLHEDCHTLADVLDAYPEGLDERHVSWMLRRVLEIMTWVHRQGYVHGALLPSNILIRPRDHGAVILDWTTSVKIGSPVRLMVKDFEKLCYPPEVREKSGVGPSFDVYMIGRLAWLLLFGWKEKRRPVSPLVLGPVKAALIAKSELRWQDTFEFYQQFDKNIRKLFGPPRFIEFTMP